MPFSPFKNESDALTINGLKLENRTDRVQIYGMLTIGRDRAGLAAAKALRDVLAQIVKELEGEPDLPFDVAEAEPPVVVKNPFA